MLSEMYDMLEHLFSKMYWCSAKRRLRSCGEKTYIEFPFIMRGGQYIQLGNNVRIRKNLQLEAIDSHNGKSFTPKIRIGNGVSINYNVHIGACNEVIIEDDVLIASRVYITDHYHGTTKREELDILPSNRILFSKGSVVIEQGAWIGEGVSIMPGVRIGRNAIVGANSVVTHDVPPYGVVGGAPARVLRIGSNEKNYGESKIQEKM